MSNRILLVEDEPDLVMIIRDRLLAEGYDVTVISDGAEVQVHLQTNTYDLILLDVMLPNMLGTEICKSLRTSGNQTLILMLTAKGSTNDKIIGLKVGADDYLAKPFDFGELLARMEALLRRKTNLTIEVRRNVELGEIEVDLHASELRKEGKPIDVSAREFQLLRYLIENPNQVHSRETLLNHVWGYDSTPTTRTVDVHIAWLRQKIETNPSHPKHLITVHKMGYKLVF